MKPVLQFRFSYFPLSVCLYLIKYYCTDDHQTPYASKLIYSISINLYPTSTYKQDEIYFHTCVTPKFLNHALLNYSYGKLLKVCVISHQHEIEEMCWL